RTRPVNGVSPSVLNGTYRYVLTKADAVAFGPPATNPENKYPVVVTWTLRDGRWISTTGSQKGVGTYTVARGRISLLWPREGHTNRFTYARDRNGTLHLSAVQPMDRGDEFAWASRAWRRI